jgi:hypothetical protein
MKIKHLVTGAVTAAARSRSWQAVRPLPGCQIKQVSDWIVEASVDYAGMAGLRASSCLAVVLTFLATRSLKPGAKRSI